MIGQWHFSPAGGCQKLWQQSESADLTRVSRRSADPPGTTSCDPQDITTSNASVSTTRLQLLIRKSINENTLVLLQRDLESTFNLITQTKKELGNK